MKNSKNKVQFYKSFSSFPKYSPLLLIVSQSLRPFVSPSLRLSVPSSLSLSISQSFPLSPFRPSVSSSLSLSPIHPFTHSFLLTLQQPRSQLPRPFHRLLMSPLFNICRVPRKEYIRNFPSHEFSRSGIDGRGKQVILE